MDSVCFGERLVFCYSLVLVSHVYFLLSQFIFQGWLLC